MRKCEERSKPESCWNKAGDQEMMFNVLSRDPVGPAAIRFWCDKRIELGHNTPDDDQIKEALECARVMQREGASHKPTWTTAEGFVVTPAENQLLGELRQACIKPNVEMTLEQKAHGGVGKLWEITLTEGEPPFIEQNEGTGLGPGFITTCKAKDLSQAVFAAKLALARYAARRIK